MHFCIFCRHAVLDECRRGAAGFRRSRYPAGGTVLGQYSAVLRDGVDNPGRAAQQLARQHGVGVGHVYRNALKGFSFSGSAAAARALARNARVAFVEPDRVVRATGQTLPTGVLRIEADQNGTANIDGVDDRVNVDIAILDTGIDLDHPELNVVAATDCARGGPRGGGCRNGEGNDGNGHGTHVAGTAAALDNGSGVVGVAPGARLWAVRVLGNDGSGWPSWIIAGIDWVTARADQIEVANMSLGFEGQSDALDAAISNSVAAGITYVVSAGNSTKDAATFSPANHSSVIAVSAVADFDGQPGGGAAATCRQDEDDTFANFSNFGAVVDIAAPGVCILSTWKDGGYNTISGTSMAAPHVTGAAALVKAANPAFVPVDVLNALLASGIPQGSAEGFTGDPDGLPEPLLNVRSAPPNDAPAVSITSPADGSVFGSGATISFAGTAADTEDRDLTASLVWTSDIDGQIGTGGSFQASLSDGDHTITASAADSGGKSGSDSVGITAGHPPAGPTAVSVDAIGYATEGGKNQTKHLLITVALLDDLSSPVGGASVSIALNRAAGGSWVGTGTTGTGGTVTFTLKNAPSGCYTTEVDQVVAGGLTWDGAPPPNQFCK